MPPAPAPEVFEGADFYPAWFGVGTVAVLGLVGIPVAGALGASWPWLLLAAVLVAAFAAIAAGARYRLTISADGVELVELRAWILPVRRTRWLLDARIELYESLDADAPQGLWVGAARPLLSKGSDCFGPKREGELRVLWAAARAALERQRATAPPCPPELRHARLGPQSARLDLGAAARHPGGRLHEVHSLGPVDIAGLEIPAGSLLRFNVEPFVDPAFIDPRRDDVLVEVQVAGPVAVYGRTAKAGALIRFDGERAITTRNAFEREVEIDGWPVRGDELLGFRADGKLDAFTLARALRVGDVTLPADSKLNYWSGGRLLPPRWTCWLGAALALPETTLVEGESCELSEDLTRLTAISPHRDLVLSQGRIRGGVMSIPLTAEGRIDVRACRKRSLL